MRFMPGCNCCNTIWHLVYCPDANGNDRACHAWYRIRGGLERVAKTLPRITDHNDVNNTSDAIRYLMPDHYVCNAPALTATIVPKEVDGFVESVTTVQNGSAVAPMLNEIQRIEFRNALSGTFTITTIVAGAPVTTAPIAYNATPSAVAAAIDASRPPSNGVTCFGGPMNTSPVDIHFNEFLSQNIDHPQLTMDTTNLVHDTKGWELTIDGWTTNAANPAPAGTCEVLNGTFDLKPDNPTTGEIATKWTSDDLPVLCTCSYTPPGCVGFAGSGSLTPIQKYVLIAKTFPEFDYGTEQNEIQAIHQYYYAATTGTFTLTYEGETTAAISGTGATAAQIQTALEALSNIGTGNVSCTGGPLTGNVLNGDPPNPVLVEFTGTLAKKNIRFLKANNSGLVCSGSDKCRVYVSTTRATSSPGSRCYPSIGSAGIDLVYAEQGCCK